MIYRGTYHVISLTTRSQGNMRYITLWSPLVYYKVITWLQGSTPKGECVHFSHIPSNHVIIIMFHTLVVESIVGITVKL